MAQVQPATTPAACQVDISGLREQIFDSAAHIFPSVVEGHLTTHNTTFANANEVFDIVVQKSASHGFTAFLTYGSFGARQTAAQGRIGPDLVGALGSLFEVVSMALQDTTLCPLGLPEENTRKCAGGCVDEILLYEGAIMTEMKKQGFQN